MNKIVIGLGIFLFLFSFVVAQDEPSVEVGSEDVEKIQKAIDNYVPIDETGEVNFDKYKPFRTKADERIDAINLWLEENASWLKVVFGMVPSITLLFAINFYVLLFFIVTLILNANATFGLLEFLGQKIDLIFFEASWANLFGFAIFVVLLVTKVFVKLSNIFYGLWDIVWNYILPWGFAIAIIIGIAVGVVFIFLLISAPHVLATIGKKFEERKRKKAMEKEAINREVLEKVVDGVTGN